MGSPSKHGGQGLYALPFYKPGLTSFFVISPSKAAGFYNSEWAMALEESLQSEWSVQLCPPKINGGYTWFLCLNVRFATR